MKNRNYSRHSREGGNPVFSYIAMTLAFALFASSAFAGAGKSGGQFLRVGVGARAAGMGGAFSPIADDVTSIYWNPAGLASLEKKEATLSYNAYFVDTAGQFAGYGHPVGDKGVFGVGLSLFSVSDIEKRSAAAGDADIPDLGMFKTQDMALAVAWASKLDLAGKSLQWGASLKYVSSDLDTANAQTAALDLGAKLNLSENVAASLAVLNLGGGLKFQNESDPLPLNIKPGIGYKHDLGGLGKLNLALDADILVNDGLAYVQPGFEWWFYKGFAFRGGWQIGRAAGAGPGLGVGVGFRHERIMVDYGFVPFGSLGDTHRVSLGYRF